MIFLSPIPDIIRMSYVNSFFSFTARLLNSLCSEWFPFTYDLNGFQLGGNCHHLYLNSLWTKFLISSSSIFLLFLVTPYLFSAVQLFMEWNPVKRGNTNATRITLKILVGKLSSYLLYVKLIMTAHTRLAKNHLGTWKFKG